MSSSFWHQNQFFLAVLTLQMLPWLLIPDHVLAGLLISLQLETYCNNLQSIEGYCYKP